MDGLRRRSIRRALVCAVAAMLLFAFTVPAYAGVKIVEIRYDPNGVDSATNDRLNHEWVQIRNRSRHGVYLGGWRIRNDAGRVFELPHMRLKAGWAIRIHSGAGDDSYGRLTDLYWFSRRGIWKNGGDIATLKRGSGAIASRCSYKGGGTSKIC